MRYIEIQEGITVNTEKIQAIERINESSCHVYIGSQTYLSTLPYSLLVSMVKAEKDNGYRLEEVADKLDGVLDNSQFFAG